MPPTDPRYLAATYDEMRTEVYAHQYAKSPEKYDNTFENPDFEEDLAKFLAEPEDDLEDVPAQEAVSEQSP